MKKTIITLVSALAFTGAAQGQSFINWLTTLDTNGNVLGTTNGQTFDVGNGVLLTATWSGTFLNGAPTGTAASVTNTLGPGAGNTDSNSITFTSNVVTDFGLRSQSNAGAANASGTNFETGTVTAAGPSGAAINLVSNTVAPLTVSGNVLNYGAASGTGGQFIIDFQGTSFTYDYSATGYNGTVDSFSISAVAAEVVPEPSSAILLGLGGLGFLARRKRA